ncbi:hypothetical protein QQX98_001485 [Neonectria punicea]|uniref:Alpha/beta hydrolase fold-3 domain-containing protein n=1 Tax=Neonectria punicea TaxID=979145 RepID=A0ABR1HNF7_9HYPO
MGTPDSNDYWNSQFASTHSAVVIALNYTKAPGAPFPQPIHDLEALFRAALDDEDLLPHIDRSQIALAGWSAGANLALAISQLPSIREHLTAIVPMYPMVEFGLPYAEKIRTRRYKPSLGGFRARETDYLLKMMPMFDWAYLPHGQNLHDPLLCPLFATRETLPQRVFVIGCEMDMLAHEAWRLACTLARRELPDMGDVVGQENVAEKKGELILTDERYHWEVKGGEGSESWSYKWLLVPDTIHGFDQTIGRMVKDPELVADAQAKTKECIQLIGEWLFRES